MEANHTCPTCSKVFTTRQGKSRHILYHCQDKHKRGTPIVLPAKVQPKEIINEINVLLKRHEERNETEFLNTVLNMLKSQKLKDETNDMNTQTNTSLNTQNVAVNNGTIIQSTVVNNTSNTTNTNVENVIVINNFGNETLEHISNDFLNKCVRERKRGIVNLLDKIFFDPNVPENRNVKLISRKQKVLGTYKNGTWLRSNSHSVLEDMIGKGYKILYKHYLANVEPDAPNDEHSYDAFMNHIQNTTSNIYYQVRKDVYFMIENATLYVVGK